MLTVSEPKKPGYQAVWNYGQWRLAMTQDAPQTHKEGITQLSRHMQTDEAFTLMEGAAGIYIGDGDAEIGNVTYHAFEPGKTYVVHAATWHCVCTQPGCKILIVENEDTGRHNTEFLPVTQEQLP
jgi:hypothetical protein